jgi:hypothetical protein
MNQVFVGQTDLLIKMFVDRNIVGATVTRIAYRNPKGVEGFFNATVENATTGILVYPAINNELNVAGTWTFWAEITLASGLIAIGTPFNYRISNKGQSS